MIQRQRKKFFIQKKKNTDAEFQSMAGEKWGVDQSIGIEQRL